MAVPQKAQILLVDDHAGNLLTMEAILQSQDWDIIKAQSGHEALRYLLRQDFAVILLDVQMPNMDGFETASLIRSRERSQDIPIIFLTAYNTNDMHVFKGYSVGAMDYLFKPVVPEILRSKVEILVRLYNKNEEVKRQVVQLEQANRELEELEAFSYSVAHDLRNPLGQIYGFSDLFLAEFGEEVSEQGREYLRQISASATRMADLIDDLLRLSLATRGELIREHVDLSLLFSTLVHEVQKRDPSRQVTIQIENGVSVYADSRLLQIVLENLIGNAWKYTSRHSTSKIEFGTQIKEGERVYYVKDDGAGFDMNAASKLFSAFQRLHTRMEFEGTGIGLAIVKRVVERHSGRIWAEGEIEKGATFFFTLGSKERDSSPCSVELSQVVNMEQVYSS
jgi:two-component system sensor histidine kinase/response regulator